MAKGIAQIAAELEFATLAKAKRRVLDASAKWY